MVEWKEEAFSLGMTLLNTMENIKTTENMDMESIYQKMGKFMMENGRTV